MITLEVKKQIAIASNIPEQSDIDFSDLYYFSAYFTVHSVAS
jgi:hypothetical protein